MSELDDFLSPTLTRQLEVELPRAGRCHRGGAVREMV
jgi:hypothetical protein